MVATVVRSILIHINDQQLQVYPIHTISQLFVALESIDNILEIVYQNSIKKMDMSKKTHLLRVTSTSESC